MTEVLVYEWLESPSMVLVVVRVHVTYAAIFLLFLLCTPVGPT